MSHEDIIFTAEHASTLGGEHSSLPVATTPLFGREDELAQLCAMLRQTEIRLVTLTGPGGVGKTRLSLAVASAVQSDFIDGVCFISLAPVSDPAKFVPTVAQALGLWETRDRPLTEQLQTFLKSQHRLLLMDNFEQVVAAAPQLSLLLSSCPRLHLLVTSRATLHLSGEYEFSVAPLAVPNLAQYPEQQTFKRVPSVHLFLERARAVRHSFALTQANGRAIAEICVRLEGLPLAIELAAAHIKLLSPQALLKRLTHRLDLLTNGACDLPARQQTLRSTLQWSYDLLSCEEQRLFRWLSVFVGGCTLEAVEAVCLVGNTSMTGVLDRVTSLIDKSLLQQAEQGEEEPRFVMLETMREYGLERLAAHRELEEARRAHANFYVRQAEESEPHFVDSEQKVWLNWWERELDNVRAALHWTATGGEEEVQLALRLSSALKEFWFGRGHLNEGRDFLEQFLARNEVVDPRLRLKALEADGRLAWFQSDHRRVEQVAEQYLSLARQLDEPLSDADVLFARGLVAQGKREYTQARLLFEEALVLTKESKVPLLGFLLMNLGRLTLSLGDESKAAQFLEEGLGISRAEDHSAHIIISLYYLARAEYKQGAFTRAQALLEEALALCREVDSRWAMARVLCVLGQVTLLQGELNTADSLLKESIQLYHVMGDQRGEAIALLHAAGLATIQKAYARAYAHYEESLAIALELKKEGLIGAAFKGLGIVAAAKGQPMLAARFWGAAGSLQKGHDFAVLSPLYQTMIANVRTQLSEQAFTQAWAEGGTLHPKQIHASGKALLIPSPTPARFPSASLAGRSTPLPAGLTAREVEVLRLVAQGLTDTQVAGQLVISYRTITTHLTSIYNKLGVNSRAAAVRFAAEYQLI